MAEFNLKVFITKFHHWNITVVKWGIRWKNGVKLQLAREGILSVHIAMSFYLFNKKVKQLFKCNRYWRVPLNLYEGFRGMTLCPHILFLKFPLLKLLSNKFKVIEHCKLFYYQNLDLLNVCFFSLQFLQPRTNSTHLNHLLSLS